MINEIGNEVFTSENIKVSIDWISFTVFHLYTVEEVLEFLGYTSEHFVEMPKGGNGYKNMLKLNGHSLYILYNGNEDMGIHVSISGSAIYDCISNFKNSLKCETPWGEAYDVTDFQNTVMIEFLTRLRQIGQLSRLDLAVDDIGGNYYTTRDLVEILEEQRCVSKFRTYRNLEESTLSGEFTGHTVYLGSRSSDIMMRVYDKKLEQNKKLQSQEKELIEYDWYRWEMELKDMRANSAADTLIEGKNIGFIVSAILNNYFRVIILDNNNRSRCSTTDKWIAFVNTVSKVGLFIPSEKRTIKDKRVWIVKQVLPTLTGVIIADGGTFDIITKNIETSINRMSKEMLEIVSQENPKWYYEDIA